MHAQRSEFASARQLVEAAAAALIDILDRFDGDPDCEDATDAEDEGVQPFLREDAGPGCIASDGGDLAWVEWDRMRGSQKGGPNILGSPPGRFSEDDEEDDGGGDCTDDEPGFDRISRAEANSLGVHLGGAGCTISDPDTGIEDGPEGTPGVDC